MTNRAVVRRWCRNDLRRVLDRRALFTEPFVGVRVTSAWTATVSTGPRRGGEGAAPRERHGRRPSSAAEGEGRGPAPFVTSPDVHPARVARLLALEHDRLAAHARSGEGRREREGAVGFTVYAEANRSSADAFAVMLKAWLRS
jgi:hypothetical protein